MPTPPAQSPSHGTERACSPQALSFVRSARASPGAPRRGGIAPRRSLLVKCSQSVGAPDCGRIRDARRTSRIPRLAPQGHATEELRAGFGAGPWRLRHHLPGARHHPRPDGRHQGISADDARPARRPVGRHSALDRARRGFHLGPRPLPRGSAHSGDARRRALGGAGPRFPGSQRHRLHGDGARPRRNPGAAPEARPVIAGASGGEAAVSAARRAGAGPCRGLPPPRHQAGQHHSRCRRQSHPDRFRRLAGIDGRSHLGDDRDLHAALCGGRAIGFGPSGTMDRHLWIGRDAPLRGCRARAAHCHGAIGERRLRAVERGPACGLCAAAPAWHRCRPGAEGG